MVRSRKKYQISREFQNAIREYSQKNDTPIYILSASQRMAPAILSGIINGSMLFPRDDQRIKKIADAIGYSGPCFVVDEQQTAAAR